MAAGIALRLEKRGMETLLAEQVGQRAGILSIAAFLIVGMIILVTVNEKNARKAALDYTQMNGKPANDV